MRILCKLKNDPWIDFDREYYVLALNFTIKDGIKAYIQSCEDEDNVPIWVGLSGFEVLDQKIPSCWVRKDYGDMKDGIVSYRPESWTYDGFLEDLYDGVESAVKLFNDEAQKIYDECEALPEHRSPPYEPGEVFTIAGPRFMEPDTEDEED